MDNTHHLIHYNKPIHNDPTFSPMETNENENMIKKKNKKGSLGNGSKREMKLSTEPQSVAARERRHKISEKFKILQSLIPGGAKMDTASMLEEAIQYVKFLKSQIWLHQAIFNMDPFHDHHDHGHATSHHGHGHHDHGVTSHHHDHEQSLYSQDINDYMVMTQIYGQSTWSYGDDHQGEDDMSFDASI